MLVSGKDQVELFKTFRHDRIRVVILKIRAGIADREVVRADFESLVAVAGFFNHPVVNKLRLVYPDSGKTGAAVVKIVVFGFPSFGTVLRIGAFKLSRKKLRRFGLIPAGPGSVIRESAVVVIAQRHHKGDALTEALASAEIGVPLLFVLTAVGIIACRENKRGFRESLKKILYQFIEGGIVGILKRFAFLLVGNGKKSEALRISPRRSEFVDGTSVCIVSAVVFVFRIRQQLFNMGKMHHTSVYIRNERGIVGIDPAGIIRSQRRIIGGVVPAA